jgi:hypothetical protein
VIGIDKNEKTVPPILTQQAIKNRVSFLDKAQTEVIRKERINEPSFHVTPKKRKNREPCELF